MKRLISFELRKLLERPTAWVGLLLVLLFSQGIAFSGYHNQYAVDPMTGSEGSGGAAVAIDKTVAARYEGILTDEKVRLMVEELVPKSRPGGINAIYIYQNATQSAAARHFSDIEGNWNGKTVSDVFGEERIKIGYTSGWMATSSNLIQVFMVLSFVVMLAVSPVFSGEYGGVDNIILTARYGRSKCAAAKLTASLLLAAGAFLLVAGTSLLAAFLYYGKEGLDCSILFTSMDSAERFIPFNLTVGEMLCYQMLLGFTGILSAAGFALLFSSVCRNQLAAFAVCAGLYVLPILLPVPETSFLFHVVALLPLYHIQFVSLMAVEQMESGLLYAVWAVPAAAAFVLVGSVGSYRVFTKHQVF